MIWRLQMWITRLRLHPDDVVIVKCPAKLPLDKVVGIAARLRASLRRVGKDNPVIVLDAALTLETLPRSRIAALLGETGPAA